MSSKSIEARAIISASDRTGNFFDKIASKFKGRFFQKKLALAPIPLPTDKGGDVEAGRARAS